MIARMIKLELTRRSRQSLESYLWHLTGVFNWTIKTVELRKNIGMPYSEFDLYNLLANHSKRLGVPSSAIQGTVHVAYNAWKRRFNKLSGRPRFKSNRNKLNSICFRGDCTLKDGKIRLPNIGWVSFHEYDLPATKIAKQVTLIKKPSGWYAVLTFEVEVKPTIRAIKDAVGIDTGFKHLAILSNGEKIENPREFEKHQKQLARNQRGNGKRKTARLQERIANKRQDRNHKISRKLVNEYKEIYITKDNLKGQAKQFGKSVMSSGIGQLRRFISYKCRTDGRKYVEVDSRYTTMTCSGCQSLTGPTGLGGLNVRNWVCSECGSEHDRDVNAAINVLNSGRRYRLEMLESVALKGAK